MQLKTLPTEYFSPHTFSTHCLRYLHIFVTQKNWRVDGGVCHHFRGRYPRSYGLSHWRHIRISGSCSAVLWSLKASMWIIITSAWSGVNVKVLLAYIWSTSPLSLNSDFASSVRPTNWTFFLVPDCRIFSDPCCWLGCRLLKLRWNLFLARLIKHFCLMTTGRFSTRVAKPTAEELKTENASLRLTVGY